MQAFRQKNAKIHLVLEYITALDVAGACHVVVTYRHVFVHIVARLLYQAPVGIIDADDSMLVVLDDNAIDVVEADDMFVHLIALQHMCAIDVFLIGGNFGVVDC